MYHLYSNIHIISLSERIFLFGGEGVLDQNSKRPNQNSNPNPKKINSTAPVPHKIAKNSIRVKSTLMQDSSILITILNSLNNR